MTIHESTSLKDVAFIVCTALARQETTVVLCGGGAAAFYAPRACRTRDLDFVIEFNASGSGVQTIVDLGNKPTGNRGMYEHISNPYTLDFLRGPVEVADQIIGFETLNQGDLHLNIISVVDCLKDRLAAGIYWNDPNAAKQAAAVAKSNEVDLSVIESWCKSQDETRGQRTFNLFVALLKGSKLV